MNLRVLKVLSAYLYPEQAYSNAKMKYCQVARIEDICYPERRKEGCRELGLSCYKVASRREVWIETGRALSG